MPFEKFVPPSKRKVPKVSIKSTGTISLDKELVKSAGLDGASHVTLHFDPGQRRIGVRAASDAKEEGAIKLSHRQRVSSVRARPFFDAYRIDLTRTQRHGARFDEELGMVVVDLPDLKLKRGRRKKQV